MKQCVLLHGHLHVSFLDTLINDYRDLTDKVVSTWVDEVPEHVQLLEENGFKVILNEYPTDPAGPRPSKTISSGVEYIKGTGIYTHVLVCETCIHISNVGSLLEGCSSYDESKPTFLAWNKNSADSCGYLISTLVHAPVSFVEQYYSKYWEGNETRFDEVFYQENYFTGEKPLQYADIRTQVNLCMKDLLEKNIEIHNIQAEHVGQGNLLTVYTTNSWRNVGSTADEFVDYDPAQ